MAGGLTLKQERFINAYFENGSNAKEAARTAGYEGNDHTLEQVGYENLRKPEIDSRIRDRLAAEQATPDRIIARWAELGFMPLDDERLTVTEYDRFGNVKSVRRDYTAMNKALENMAKAAGMFRETVDININQPVRQLLYLPPDHPLRATVTQQLHDGGDHDDENVEQEM